LRRVGGILRGRSVVWIVLLLGRIWNTDIDRELENLVFRYTFRTCNHEGATIKERMLPKPRDGRISLFPAPLAGAVNFLSHFLSETWELRLEVVLWSLTLDHDGGR